MEYADGVTGHGRNLHYVDLPATALGRNPTMAEKSDEVVLRALVLPSDLQNMVDRPKGLVVYPP